VLLKQLEVVLAVVLLLEMHLYHPVQYGIKTEDVAAVEVIIKIQQQEFRLFQLHGGEWVIYLLHQEMLILYKDIMEWHQKILLADHPLQDLAVAEPEEEAIEI
tara:strand:+ start:143 stop:451 length:309 start_codon:yes stop_codon:yes gene_type:complete